MQFQAPGPISVFSFLYIVALMPTALIYGVYYVNRKFMTKWRAIGRAALAALGCVAWLILTSAVVLSGALESAPMPAIPAFFALSNLAALALAFSSLGLKLALELPLWVLVFFHAFRFPLELVLHEWAKQGTIPGTMTWTGSNFDVITGVIALASAPFVTKRPRIAWVVNCVGIVLLLNVARVAILSSPLPFAWQVDPPLQLAFHLPYAWILPFCVAGAVAGHVILTRALLRK